MKKVYLVYKEVIANSVSDAAKAKGNIYQIMEANDEMQLKLLTKKTNIGFKKK